ncbi:PREDICTED: putative E3 ubiquitin-protein ligase SH3RF2 [Thamnophis sirtalis]|uniref:E3 ubiquitin-protein ligase SH3RF2 n=1 Tax=Thamnophis sirtalis TaxID=35019 RepID=A0A6I9XZI9_9SAUR|nr:PREDICTED: putative E3 ubiquitin-protein ligase SH3RF2 [Thamnophis sirtalis]XP_013919336.1 PREDICTED: putative E3 ubiquitin-protein ligase SH3RF2 [Thamnophis sirtalis]XP_013919337.1 PREDICTED: putative E3 ubiquitin-protein ligase SH3RF2 [Thamnophis sirtalis]XP_013919338.1 PREDICTED: putative E3 ubiquitin-protein ligase SH3RF2 [Thamnophis sirtalis]XP_013919341.1 PREDICTED: putative E3 ubiquitin-protein ligase SH3RF2 [Thamnophis sirtalis]XP_013919342.1 PREDICTED: putative E3 ubiquitin-protein
MDNLSLSDMLECPVCLEKLDASAKVLPCQHTFCKPCLQRILKSHKELRCPECRTLVLSNIEELPSNLFLIRLLDGIRFGTSMMKYGSLQRSSAFSSPASIRKMGGGPKNLELDQYRMTSSPRIPLEEVPRAKALYSYRGQNPGELRFNKGDIITLYRQLDENWYLGEINRVSGVFPTNAVQIIKQLPQPPPLCRALYNFNLKSKNKNEKPDCLSFHKGDIITMISRMDENWAEGKLGDRTGIFPILFVEPNTTAQQLLQRSKSYQSSPQKCASPLQRFLPRSKGAESPTFCKGSESRRKTMRQFSITTALNTLNRMVHSPTGRQTLDISPPVLISSSNPCVTAKHQEKLEAPYNTPDQVSPFCYLEPESMGHSTAIVSLPHLQQHLSLNMSVALHSYTAHSPDELNLQKGEGIRVLGKYREGWLKGMSLITGKVGVFPSNYVAPFFRKSSGFSDSKMPSLYATWTLSTSSLSSQGSISGNRPGQSRPLKSLTSPVRNLSLPSASGHTASMRRGRSSNKKSGSLQKPLQPGALIPLTNSLQRHPPTPARSQQTPIYQSISSLPRGVGLGDTGIKLSAYHNSSLVLLPRSGSSRAPSVCSSVILDTSEVSKNELAGKPPASAPPSILVKPDTLKNTTEKQVKTVRFQNYSPPPSKRHNSVSSLNFSNGKPEQGVITEAIQPESNIKSPEISSLYSHRIISSSGHQKRMSHHKTSPLDLSSPTGHPTFPTKKNYSGISEN